MTKLQSWIRQRWWIGDSFRTWMFILLAIIISGAWGWSLVSNGLVANIVCWLPMALFVIIVAALLTTHPLWTLGLQVIVLSTIPLLRIYLPFQEVPLYIIDVLMVLALLGTIWRNRCISTTHFPTPVRWGLLGFGLASFISSFNLAITSERFIEALYPFLRHLLLTVGMFYVTYQLLRTHAQQRIILILLLIGAVINALLAVIQNLAGIQSLGAEIPLFLYGERAFPYYYSGRFEAIVKGEYQRGFGFFQAATVLSGFLSMVLPICVLSGKSLIRHSIRRNFLTALLVAGILGTYSRQAIIGLLLSSIMVILVLRKIQVSVRLLIILISLGAIAIALNIVDISLLYFRFQQLGDLQETSMARRIEGYFKFINYITEQPVRILIGNGTGIIDLSDRGFLPFFAEHLLFSGFVSNSYILMLYNLGILGFLSYILLFGAIIRRAMHHLSKQVIGLSNHLFLGLLSALLVAAVLHIFDNYFAESYQIRGIFWLLMSMTLKATYKTTREVDPTIGIARKYGNKP